MLREIKNAIYCIASYTGNRHFVECDSEDELAAYVAEKEKELTEEKLENMFRKYLRIVTDEQLPVDYKSVENFS